MSNICYGGTYEGTITIWDPRKYCTVEVHKPSWTKRGTSGVWAFKGKASNLQVNEEEQICGKQILVGPPQNNEIQREV